MKLFIVVHHGLQTELDTGPGTAGFTLLLFSSTAWTVLTFGPRGGTLAGKCEVDLDSFCKSPTARTSP